MSDKQDESWYNRYSPEALDRIDEAQERVDKMEAQKKIEAAEKEAKWSFYKEQLAKMTPYTPGSKKARGAQRNLDNVFDR